MLHFIHQLKLSFLLISGFNRKFNNDSGLRAHPNPYKLCGWIKRLLKEADEEAFCVQNDKKSKRNPSKKYENLKLRRKNQMIKLRDLDIKMNVFLSSVGAMTLRLDKKVTAELAANKAESISESVNQDESIGFSSQCSQDSQDSQDESFGFSSQDSQNESQELDDSLDLELEKIQNESMASSEDNSNSILEEDSFDASALWHKRKEKEIASNVKENLEPKGRKRKNLANDPYSDEEEITMVEGWRLAQIIMEENNMELSPTQRDTPGKK